MGRKKKSGASSAAPVNDACCPVALQKIANSATSNATPKHPPSNAPRTSKAPHITDTPASHRLQLPDSSSGILRVLWWFMICLTILLALVVLHLMATDYTSFPRIVMVVSMPVLLWRYGQGDTQPPSAAVKADAVQPTGGVIKLHNVLSHSEARHYIQQGLTLMRRDVDGNSLGAKARPMMSQVAMIGPEAGDQTIDQSQDETIAGTWEPVGINTCWRLSAYQPGQRCAPYTQSKEFESEDRVMTLKCIMLNLSAQKAAVNFFDENLAIEGQYRIRCTSELDCGAALAFNHGTQYQGKTVERGEQWVMFSDVLYKQIPQANDKEPKQKPSTAQKKKERKRRAADKASKAN